MIDLNQLVGEIGSEGWDAFDTNLTSSRMAEDKARRDEMALAEASIVARALDNEAGRELVKWLVGKTITLPADAYEQTASNIEMYALAKARREGERGVVFMIINALRYAQGIKNEGQ